MPTWLVVGAIEYGFFKEMIWRFQPAPCLSVRPLHRSLCELICKYFDMVRANRDWDTRCPAPLPIFGGLTMNSREIGWGKMGDQEPEESGKLEVFHVCEKCGTSFRPGQVNEDVNATGVIECPVCSHIGPLRIQILPQNPS